MKRRYKVLGTICVLWAVVTASLAAVLSHDSPCGSADPLPPNTVTMKAIVYRCYGTVDVLKLEDIAKPMPADDRVLVRVHAASVNPLDWHYMRGRPYFARAMMGVGSPDSIHMGADFAGTVESVGKNVRRFKPGDDVFGDRDGAFGEYVSVAENGAVAHKPSNATMEQAAAVPVAAITALQALRDKGRLQAGQSLLVNGASGGVGTFAVQIAKAYGARVTAVTSARNVQLVRSLGADWVIDYAHQDFTQSVDRYDMILDCVGNHPLTAIRNALKPGGVAVLIGGGGPDAAQWGPLFSGPILAILLSPFVSEKLIFMLSNDNKDDLAVLGQMMQAGKLTSVIDRRYTLAETAAAIQYVEQGHVRGKVVITVD